jgi:hypothetical protein
MKSIKEILDTIFEKTGMKNKWQKKFLFELFELVFAIQGRANFHNMSRYSDLNESTFRRNFSKFFDWIGFNLAIMFLSGLSFCNPVIAAIDCSYIPKAGKVTYGLDRFWSGVAGRAKQGLELSVLSLIDVLSGTAWTLDATQTPPDLSSREGNGQEYTRVDFYLEQILDLLPFLRAVTYIVADGFYAKAKVFDAICLHGKHLITKLRPDANLRYLFNGVQRTGKKGAKKKYSGKVCWKKLDLSKWIHIGTDVKYDYLQIYTQVLNSPHFKRNLKVVLLWNTKSNQYILLASTDLSLSPRLIVTYYQLRFKIEFLFRDAKQFTGLTHCQARDEDKLDFHFNMSLAAINLAQLYTRINKQVYSMNSIVRKAYNTRFAKILFSQLSSEAEFDINHSKVQKIIEFGCMRT